jgi:hypothetical protein
MATRPTPQPVGRDELLARIAALEEENASLRERPFVEREAHERPRPRRGRTAGAVAVIVIAALLAPLAVTAMWVRGLVADTDRYLETVAPLADDPAVQQAVIGQITAAIVEEIDPEELAGQATSAIADLDLPPTVSTAVRALQTPLADAISSFVREGVARVVTSDAFANVWVEANRTAHEQLVAVLRGDPEAIATLDDGGDLSINLESAISVVTTSLSEQGFTIVDRLPSIDVNFNLMSNSDLVRLRQVYRLIDVLGPVLIWVTLGLLALGVVLAANWSRALMIGGFVLAGSAVLLAAVITVGRGIYTDALVGQVQRLDAALVVYDGVMGGLRMSARTTLALGLVLVVVGFLLGSSSTARSLRSAVGRAEQATGPSWLTRVRQTSAARWVAGHRGGTEGAVAVLAGVTLVAADRLSPAYIVTVALIALMVVLTGRVLAPRGPLPAADGIVAEHDDSAEPVG